MPKKKSANTPAKGNGANLGFEQKLWAAADKMRGHNECPLLRAADAWPRAAAGEGETSVRSPVTPPPPAARISRSLESQLV